MSIDTKTYASRIKESLKKRGHDISLGEVYNILSEAVGVKNHHVAKAQEIEVGPTGWEMGLGGGIVETALGKFDPTQKVYPEHLERFEIEIVQPVMCSMTLGVYAQNFSSAYAKALNYFDDNVDHCRDEASNWSFESAIDGGEYRRISEMNCTSRYKSIDTIGSLNHPYIQEGVVYRMDGFSYECEGIKASQCLDYDSKFKRESKKVE